MSLSHALQRLRAATAPRSDARRGAGADHVHIDARDLIELLDEHDRIDAILRTAHFHANRPAYPPRVNMLARAASDPGLYAGARGERTMGRWIADAILALEHQQAPEELKKLAGRMHQIAVRFGKTRGEISYALEEGAAELLQQSGRIERLRRIIHSLGDRHSLAWCPRSDWQNEIDDAMEWVAGNPEPADDQSHDRSVS